ncbi:MAG: 7TM diverse intracellular signaling domain-containing protein [Pedobacter sp.]|uniref:7TM diverse intracellular signaling domain-containing protein n=1 Tax=Pedobacter sp. TaxID=1411316 RepID=UPI002809FCF6|nr:7TM diverse intracellular signaling domain-containing protein [Pedobacter sp.]MDQ8003754.1 7TM diverse intracellular signaling domain-containing protein [Pedobacter sp.]
MRNNLFIFKLLLSFSLCLYATLGKAQHEFEFQHHDQIRLKPHFRILEDKDNLYHPEALFANPHQFQKIDQFKPSENDHAFWLLTTFKAGANTEAIVSFRHLTFAELYFRADTPNAPLSHRKAGAFRPLNKIHSTDSRFHFSIDLAKDVTYQLLIKSTHVKKYEPIFDFQLNNKNDFLAAKTKSEFIDFWLQGASVLLILYVLLSWLSTKYRPYLWLALFASGFYLYDIALNRYLIDWFFPNHPQSSWLSIQTFLHIGLLGLFLLIIDSWNLKAKNQQLYKYGKVLIVAIILLSITSFIINYLTLNYNLTTKINILFSFIPITYATYTVCKLWKQLDKQERYLAYGLALYFSATLFFNITISIWGEKLYLLTPIASKVISISVVLLFLTGLNARLRQNEKDKLHYLNELNLLQKHQNEILERNVTVRTEELNQRNERIETLMNELNHRVKNNLQLLYSLNSLQLSSVIEPSTLHVLKDNIARIKAMMLVNDSLNPLIDATPHSKSLKEFISEIAAHSKRMFLDKQNVEIDLAIDEDLILDSKTGLSLGLIVSELITNSFKHAFAAHQSPKIHISISSKIENWVLSYSDNGVGITNATNNGFGISLINDLTRQLKGNVKLTDHNGLNYTFNFPK